MTQLDYITRSLAKAEKKRFEHYVISRIWHLLNDLTIKFVTQQYVTRPTGRALTDMYFPQLHLHIEVDEGFHKTQLAADAIREADIINATGHEVMRVDITKGLEEIHNSVDTIVTHIRAKKSAQPSFKPWDIEAESNPQTYIDKGHMDVEEEVAFKTMVDAANCFGNNYQPKGIWKGGAKHPKETDKIIWFPKLYTIPDWDNQLSNDESQITERCMIPDAASKHFQNTIERNIYKRIVFAQAKSPLGDIMYRFKGEYHLDLTTSHPLTGLIWRRISKRVKTYPQIANPVGINQLQNQPVL